MSNDNLIQKILKTANKISPDTIENYHWLHQHPEIKFEEFETSAYLENKLKTMGYSLQKTADTGIIASIAGSQGGPTVALRADIDALNVTEQTSLSFPSLNTGKMHACGHDAHMAMLIGAAKIIVENRDKIKGSVKLIFQPGEEGGAGAKRICDEGHLNDVDCIFGIHVWMELPAKTVLIKSGPLMAAADDFEIRILGKGGHAAQPHLNIDPTAVAVDIYNQIQKIISREIDPQKSAVISVPYIKGSDAFNVIPDEVTMRGTARSFDPEIQNYLIDRIKTIVEGCCLASRCTGTFSLLDESYPPVINSEKLVKNIAIYLPQTEFKILKEDTPTMAAEDFSFYQRKVPGVFIFLGMKDEEKGIIYPHHHPKFRVNESVLETGTALYTLLGFYSSFVD
jgi:amidohydrolase